MLQEGVEHTESSEIYQVRSHVKTDSEVVEFKKFRPMRITSVVHPNFKSYPCKSNEKNNFDTHVEGNHEVFFDINFFSVFCQYVCSISTNELSNEML